MQARFQTRCGCWCYLQIPEALHNVNLLLDIGEPASAVRFDGPPGPPTRTYRTFQLVEIHQDRNGVAMAYYREMK